MNQFGQRWMGRPGRFVWVALGLLLLGTRGTGLDSPPFVLLQRIGPARLYSNVPREDGLVLVKFSGVLEFAIEVDGDRGLEVDPPARWVESPTWKITHVEPATLSKHGEVWRWRQSFMLDPTTPAVEPIQLRPLHYRNADGRPHTIDPWKPIPVKIVVQSPKPTSKSMREHPMVEDVPPAPPESEWIWPVLIVTSVVAMLCVFIFLLRRRTVRSVPKRTCAATALYELTRLEALALPDRGQSGEFHTLLANVVRRYVEKRYHLPARRLTTPEFLNLLKESPLLTGAQKGFLKSFLHQCDLIKFAEAQVTAQQCRELGRQTRDFLTSEHQDAVRNSGSVKNYRHGSWGTL